MKHAIINRIVAVIALAAVIAALVFFGLWRQVESQRAEQQKQLDQTFAMQFSQLYENLFCTEQVEKVRQESLGQAAVCEAVFPIGTIQPWEKSCGTSTIWRGRKTQHCFKK